MAKINLDLLKDVYLCDANISSTSELVGEAIASIENYAECLDYEQLYSRNRILAIAYMALIELKAECESLKSKNDALAVELYKWKGSL